MSLSTVKDSGRKGGEKGRVENVEFAVKDLPLGRTLRLIDKGYRAYAMGGSPGELSEELVT